MPVPSSMIGSSETKVESPCGRVVSATARIIGIGPTAKQQVNLAPPASSSPSRAAVKPWKPSEPSSVHGS